MAFRGFHLDACVFEASILEHLNSPPRGLHLRGLPPRALPPRSLPFQSLRPSLECVFSRLVFLRFVSSWSASSRLVPSRLTSSRRSSSKLVPSRSTSSWVASSCLTSPGRPSNRFIKPPGVRHNRNRAFCCFAFLQRAWRGGRFSLFPFAISGIFAHDRCLC